MKWHGGRPQHEQKRFLMGVKSLYEGFSEQYRKQESGKQVPANEIPPAQQPMQPIPEDSADGLQEPQPQQLAASASAPVLPRRPIEVFEQKKRSRLRRNDPDKNTLQKWLEDMSASSQWTATDSQATTWTNISSMTQTTLGSACSAPITMAQQQFRSHVRANAVNMRRWKTPKAHEPGALGAGIPHDDYPDNCRLKTSFGDAFGEKPLGMNIKPQMYESVFRDEGHPFIEGWLQSAAPEKREQFGNMVRALQNLRTANHYNTMYVVGYDLAENKRLWQPKKAKAVRSKIALQQSRIPLGNLAEAGKIKKPREDPLLEKLRLELEKEEARQAAMEHGGPLDASASVPSLPPIDGA
jgi:hypothetical protein